jgi:hypothetical protein
MALRLRWDEPKRQRIMNLSERIKRLQEEQEAHKKRERPPAGGQRLVLPEIKNKDDDDMQVKKRAAQPSADQNEWTTFESFANFAEADFGDGKEEKENSFEIKLAPQQFSCEATAMPFPSRPISGDDGDGALTLTEQRSNASESRVEEMDNCGSVLPPSVDQKIDHFLSTVAKLSAPEGASKEEMDDWNQIVNMVNTAFESNRSPNVSRPERKRRTPPPDILRDPTESSDSSETSGHVASFMQGLLDQIEMSRSSSMESEGGPRVANFMQELLAQTEMSRSSSGENDGDKGGTSDQQQTKSKMIPPKRMSSVTAVKSSTQDDQAQNVKEMRASPQRLLCARRATTERKDPLPTEIYNMQQTSDARRSPVPTVSPKKGSGAKSPAQWPRGKVRIRRKEGRKSPPPTGNNTPQPANRAQNDDGHSPVYSKEAYVSRLANKLAPLEGAQPKQNQVLTTKSPLTNRSLSKPDPPSKKFGIHEKELASSHPYSENSVPPSTHDSVRRIGILPPSPQHGVIRWNEPIYVADKRPPIDRRGENAAVSNQIPRNEVESPVSSSAFCSGRENCSEPSDAALLLGLRSNQTRNNQSTDTNSEETNPKDQEPDPIREYWRTFTNVRTKGSFDITEGSAWNNPHRDQESDPIREYWQTFSNIRTRGSFDSVSVINEADGVVSVSKTTQSSTMTEDSSSCSVIYEGNENGDPGKNRDQGPKQHPVCRMRKKSDFDSDPCLSEGFRVIPLPPELGQRFSRTENRPHRDSKYAIPFEEKERVMALGPSDSVSSLDDSVPIIPVSSELLDQQDSHTSKRVELSREKAKVETVDSEGSFNGPGEQSGAMSFDESDEGRHQDILQMEIVNSNVDWPGAETKSKFMPRNPISFGGAVSRSRDPVEMLPRSMNGAGQEIPSKTIHSLTRTHLQRVDESHNDSHVPGYGAPLGLAKNSMSSVTVDEARNSKRPSVEWPTAENSCTVDLMPGHSSGKSEARNKEDAFQASRSVPRPHWQHIGSRDDSEVRNKHSMDSITIDDETQDRTTASTALQTMAMGLSKAISTLENANVTSYEYDERREPDESTRRSSRDSNDNSSTLRLISSQETVDNQDIRAEKSSFDTISSVNDKDGVTPQRANKKISQAEKMDQSVFARLYAMSPLLSGDTDVDARTADHETLFTKNTFGDDTLDGAATVENNDVKPNDICCSLMCGDFDFTIKKTGWWC